jgi:hypothetical protein
MLLSKHQVIIFRSSVIVIQCCVTGGVVLSGFRCLHGNLRVIWKWAGVVCMCGSDIEKGGVLVSLQMPGHYPDLGLEREV